MGDRFSLVVMMVIGLPRQCQVAISCFPPKQSVFNLCYFKIVDKIEIQRCYVDIDRKFKRQHGIILEKDQFQRLARGIKFIDAKLLRMKNDLDRQQQMNAGKGWLNCLRYEIVYNLFRNTGW